MPRLADFGLAAGRRPRHDRSRGAQAGRRDPALRRDRRLHRRPRARDARAPELSYGASPRAGQRCWRPRPRAAPRSQGRDFVLPDDVKALAVPALRHRVVLAPGAEIEGAHHRGGDPPDRRAGPRAALTPMRRPPRRSPVRSPRASLPLARARRDLRRAACAASLVARLLGAPARVGRRRRARPRAAPARASRPDVPGELFIGDARRRSRVTLTPSRRARAPRRGSSSTSAPELAPHGGPRATRAPAGGEARLELPLVPAPPRACATVRAVWCGGPGRSGSRAAGARSPVDTERRGRAQPRPRAPRRAAHVRVARASWPASRSSATSATAPSSSRCASTCRASTRARSTGRRRRATARCCARSSAPSATTRWCSRSTPAS